MNTAQHDSSSALIFFALIKKIIFAIQAPPTLERPDEDEIKSNKITPMFWM